jgi:hypothetical protein
VNLHARLDSARKMRLAGFANETIQHSLGSAAVMTDTRTPRPAARTSASAIALSGTK